jgi:hypothetical protein
LHKPRACITLGSLNPTQMKTAGLILLLLICLKTSAQGVFTNNTNQAIEKVIRDYPNQFRNIQGSLLADGQQGINYQSNIQIPGALSCVISKSNFSNGDAICWKADLFESTDFRVMKDKYTALYNQIRNSIIKIEGEKPYILNGQYEIPDQRRRAQSVIFNMLPSVGEMQKLKVELSLYQQGATWRVRILIYDQPAEY